VLDRVIKDIIGGALVNNSKIKVWGFISLLYVISDERIRLMLNHYFD
jgi:hypothetical protein